MKGMCFDELKCFISWWWCVPESSVLSSAFFGAKKLTCQADFDVSSFADIIVQADAVAFAFVYNTSLLQPEYG
jgi:hypothetical protein